MRIAPWTDAQLYQIDGAYSAPGAKTQNRGITVLSGDGGPTPTGGWSQITVIPRARRLGYTINSGFAPASMDVPIRFYDPGTYANWPVAGMVNGKPVRQSVEDQIAVLEWMAGRGNLYGGADHPATGEPPSIQITSFNAAGHRTPLVPENWRSDRVADLRWQISNLQYGKAQRRANGERWWQDVTVSLIQQVATPGDLVPTHHRQTGRGTRADATKVVSTKALDTVSKICNAHGYLSAISHTDVLIYNQKKVPGSKLRGKGLHTKLAPHTVVYLPILAASVKRPQRKR